jgi:multidrug efflux pump subunit AcrA (membrane-fusion protein)
MSSPNPSLDDLRIQRRPETAAPSRSWPAAVVVALTVLAGAAFWWHGRAETVEVRTVPARAASTGGAERTVLNASGYVTAQRQATVSAKVTGKVIEVDNEEGLKVKEGQILARLDDSNLRDSLSL